MNFDEAFTRLLGHEGGYTKGKNDPGGETNWGISKRSYPYVDIKALTKEGAKEIYFSDYWLTALCDKLPEAVRFDVFDMAVNSGVSRSIRTLQNAVKVTPDGVIGPVTLAAIGAINSSRLLARFNGARLLFMAGLPTWSVFGKGWAIRLGANLLEA